MRVFRKRQIVVTIILVNVIAPSFALHVDRDDCEALSEEHESESVLHILNHVYVLNIRKLLRVNNN